MDLSTRIAPAYREKEIEIRNEISKVLERGKARFQPVDREEGGCRECNSYQPGMWWKVITTSWIQAMLAKTSAFLVPHRKTGFKLLLRMPDVMTKTEIQELIGRGMEQWCTPPYLKPSVIW